MGLFSKVEGILGTLFGLGKSTTKIILKNNSGNFSARNYTDGADVGITGSQFTSTVTTGTPPLVVTSTTECTNLNVHAVNGCTVNDSGTTTADLLTAFKILALVAGISGGLSYKGTINCSGNPNYPAADKGHLYIVDTAGKIGGTAGITVEAGTQCICKDNGTISGDQATVGTHWNVINIVLTNTVTSSSGSSTNNQLARFDSTSGLVIKTSSATLDDTGLLTVNTEVLSPAIYTTLTNGNYGVNIQETDNNAGSECLRTLKGTSGAPLSHGVVVESLSGDIVQYYEGSEIFRISRELSNTPSPNTPIFKIYAFGGSKANPVLGYNSAQNKVYPLGTWDFSSSDAVKGFNVKFA